MTPDGVSRPYALDTGRSACRCLDNTYCIRPLSKNCSPTCEASAPFQTARRLPFSRRKRWPSCIRGLFPKKSRKVSLDREFRKYPSMEACSSRTEIRSSYAVTVSGRFPSRSSSWRAYASIGSERRSVARGACGNSLAPMIGETREASVAGLQGWGERVLGTKSRATAAIGRAIEFGRGMLGLAASDAVMLRGSWSNGAWFVGR